MSLRQVDVADQVITYEPVVCCGCGADLGGAPVVGTERRQVFDLPPGRIEVTEHRLVSKVCACRTVTKAPAPEGVNAPVQYGSRLAGIGVYLFHGSRRGGGAFRRDRAAGRRPAALDALGVHRHRRAADRPPPPRVAGMDAAGILPEFTGTAVHDA